ncbi:DUF3040 domain-containing protein [bacterium]|nr:DUF3040 domain-containing protein [bacterium]
MPLDDREQKILEEIERQFYQEDPKLAETVRTATIASLSSRHLKWAVLSLVVGVALMLAFFTSSTIIALVGFVVMVVSVAWIVAILKQRAGVGMTPPSQWFDRAKRRWRDGG